MTETHPVPAIAKTAITLLAADFQRNVNVISEQTVEALKLDKDGGWTVNFDTGLISREVPDPPKESP